MINYLKVKGHKGIAQVRLDDLGQINIICGKNNSGKTSILEALTEKTKRSIGKKLKIEDMDWMVNLLSSQFDRYTDPSSGYGKEWFKRYLKMRVADNTIWYDDELSKIEADLKKEFKKDRFIGEHDVNLYQYGGFRIFLQKIHRFF